METEPLGLLYSYKSIRDVMSKSPHGNIHKIMSRLKTMVVETTTGTTSHNLQQAANNNCQSLASLASLASSLSTIYENFFNRFLVVGSFSLNAFISHLELWICVCVSEIMSPILCISSMFIAFPHFPLSLHSQSFVRI